MTGIFKNQKNYYAYLNAVKNCEGLLIGYFVAGDPNKEMFEEVIYEAVDAGIDILEIGVPSQNPIFDGDIIRRGHVRAWDTGVGAQFQNLESWGRLRNTVDTPIWVMGYQNELVKTGLYSKLCENKLVDALVLPDCPSEVIRKIASDLKSNFNCHSVICL